MKNSKNIQIHSIYKAIIAAMLFGAVASCTKEEHKNVITGVEDISYETVVSLRDVKTGQERFFVCPYNPYYNDYKYCVGDTVSVIVIRGSLPKNYYARNGILRNNGGRCYLHVNQDSVFARQSREEFYKMKERFEKER